MVLCVLQNQPKMELGNLNQTTNRKRKRKLSAPARRPILNLHDDQYESAEEGSASSEEPKIIKLNPEDQEVSERPRVPNCEVNQTMPSPNITEWSNQVEPDVYPKQEVVDSSDSEFVTKVEVVDVGTTKISSEDEEDRQYAGMPEILRNQAKSRRARAKAAAERAKQGSSTSDGHYRADTSSCGSSNRSSSPPHNKINSQSSSPLSYTPKKSTSGSVEDNKYYKNMSRERRLIANARERTRVHTISTAFDALRQAIPTYSYNQKLSKLAILRIASAYIKSLSAMAQEPETLFEQTTTEDPTKTPFSQCVSDCTKTLQMECRARSRRKGRKD